MFWIILLGLLILFNTSVSFYMFIYFHKTLKMLKANLTTLQIQERRRTNGIGMTELLMLLTLKTGLINICGAIYLLVVELKYPGALSCPLNTIWLIPAIISAFALTKMLHIKNKFQNKKG